MTPSGLVLISVLGQLAVFMLRVVFLDCPEEGSNQLVRNLNAYMPAYMASCFARIECTCGYFHLHYAYLMFSSIERNEMMAE